MSEHLVIGYKVSTKKLQKIFTKNRKGKYHLEPRYDQITGKKNNRVKIWDDAPGFWWKIPKSIDNQETNDISFCEVQDLGPETVQEAFEKLFGCKVYVDLPEAFNFIFCPKIKYTNYDQTEIKLDKIDDMFKTELEYLRVKLSQYIDPGKSVISIIWI